MVVIELGAVDQWLAGSLEAANVLLVAPAAIESSIRND